MLWFDFSEDAWPLKFPWILQIGFWIFPPHYSSLRLSCHFAPSQYSAGACACNRAGTPTDRSAAT
jgi:hypothetical protein